MKKVEQMKADNSIGKAYNESSTERLGFFCVTQNLKIEIFVNGLIWQERV